jgi:hypothetical protein
MVEVTVDAQRQCVWFPDRSISTVSPARRLGAVPENVSPRRRIADALVWSVIPLPVALTVTFPLWTDGDSAPLEGLEGLEGVEGASADPPGETPDPPDDAQPLAGSASAAHAIANTA